jgi:hypothetical protein
VKCEIAKEAPLNGLSFQRPFFQMSCTTVGEGVFKRATANSAQRHDHKLKITAIFVFYPKNSFFVPHSTSGLARFFAQQHFTFPHLCEKLKQRF